MNVGREFRNIVDKEGEIFFEEWKKASKIKHFRNLFNEKGEVEDKSSTLIIQPRKMP